MPHQPDEARSPMIAVSSRLCIVAVNLSQSAFREAIVRVRVGRWGNSLAIRVPARLAEEAGLGTGDIVELRVVERPRPATSSLPIVSLDELVAAITDDNLHAETEWGQNVWR